MKLWWTLLQRFSSWMRLQAETKNVGKRRMQRLDRIGGPTFRIYMLARHAS